MMECRAEDVCHVVLSRLNQSLRPLHYASENVLSGAMVRTRFWYGQRHGQQLDAGVSCAV